MKHAPSTASRMVAMFCASLCSIPAAATGTPIAIPFSINVTTPVAAPAKAPAATAAASQKTADSGSAAPRKQPPREAEVRTPAIAQQAGSDIGADQVETQMELLTGSQRLISLSEQPARVSLADPDIAEVTVLRPVNKTGKGSALLVVAKQTGTTSLLVWMRNQEKPQSYTLTVVAPQPLPLSNVPGLNVRTKGNAVRLEGSITDIAAYQQARDNLMRSGIGGKSAEITDATTLTTPGTVQVDVKVVEFSRNDIQRLGINFNKTNGDFKFGFGSAPTTNAASAINQALSITYDRVSPSALFAQLNALQSEGVARVLAEPTLVAQSGQSASFLAGGEIPIPVPSGASATGAFSIQFKEFGIRLAFTPTILSSKTIALKVAPEVSDLDRNNGVTINGFNVPALLTRRAETTVELGEGESFVIGGLISSNVNSVVQQFPILASVPILGGFFRNVAYEKLDKELLIIATPRFVKPRAKGAPALPLPGGPAIATRPGWGQMFLPSGDGSLPGFSR